MKAILCKQWGLPDTLTYEEAESKPPDKGEVRIRVRACGIYFGDGLMIQGLYQVKPPLPFSPGGEIAGDVIDVGEGVTQFKPGDRVIAITYYGGLAEEICVPAQGVFPLPSSMSYTDAAGFPIAYGTSHIALDHRGKLQPGETLLVLGAAGGMGLTAVEIGKLMGATVIAAASTPEKLALTQQYGADHVINYSTENIRDRIKEITGGKGVNVVYDPVGGDLLEPCLRSTAWEGRYLVIGFAGGSIPQVPVNLTLLKNCSIVGVFWGAYTVNQPKTFAASLQTLLKWHAEGRLKPHIGHTFPLEQGADALWTLIRRQAMGRVVVTVE
jgi:NADPH2:quinone reductase